MFKGRGKARIWLNRCDLKTYVKGQSLVPWSVGDAAPRRGFLHRVAAALRVDTKVTARAAAVLLPESALLLLLVGIVRWLAGLVRIVLLGRARLVAVSLMRLMLMIVALLLGRALQRMLLLGQALVRWVLLLEVMVLPMMLLVRMLLPLVTPLLLLLVTPLPLLLLLVVVLVALLTVLLVALMRELPRGG